MTARFESIGSGRSEVPSLGSAVGASALRVPGAAVIALVLVLPSAGSTASSFLPQTGPGIASSVAGAPTTGPWAPQSSDQLGAASPPTPSARASSAHDESVTLTVVAPALHGERAAPGWGPATDAAQAVRCRLAYLSTLPAGWLDGDGVAPSQEAVDIAMAVVLAALAAQPALPRPGLFPTPEGGVQAEWVRGKWAAEARFEGRQLVSADAYNTDTDEERTLPGPYPSDLATLTPIFVSWLGALS